MDGSPALNEINYLNVAAFTLSWLLNSEVGPDHNFFGFLGGMRDLGRKYRGLMTPSENTFLMSHFVLLFLGIFTVVQLLPKYRQSPLVQEGVRYYFIASSVAQLLWCMNLGLENGLGAFLSIGYMGAMLISNGLILLKQSFLSEENQEPEEYWLLRFAFSLQTGWTIALFIMVLNSFQAFVGFRLDFQLLSAFFSLTSFVLISWKMLFANGNKPNFVIPSVYAWFVLGIAFDNRDGNEMNEYFGIGFSIISALVGFGIAIATAYLVYTRHIITNTKAETMEMESDPTVYVVAPSEGTVYKEKILDEAAYTVPPEGEMA